MTYSRFISIALVILSFLAFQHYGAVSLKDSSHTLHAQKHNAQKATRFAIAKDIAKVAASGERNSSEFLFQRIQHQPQYAQVKVQASSFLLSLFPTTLGCPALHAGILGKVANVTHFLPVVYKLLYPKHSFW